MIVECELDLVIHGPDLDAYVTALMDELCELEGVVDPDIGATLATGEITISVGTRVDDEDYVDAAIRTVNMIRTALHAVGQSTAEFEYVLRDLRAAPESDGELVA